MENPAAPAPLWNGHPCCEPKIGRRELLLIAAGVLAARPHSAAAQWGSGPVVGFLGSGSPTSYAAFITAFRQGLSEMGYDEEKHLQIEFRWAGGRFERLHPLAAELAERKVDVIATGGGTPSARAAKDRDLGNSRCIFRGCRPTRSGWLKASTNRVATSPAGSATSPAK